MKSIRTFLTCLLGVASVIILVWSCTPDKISPNYSTRNTKIDAGSINDLSDPNQIHKRVLRLKSLLESTLKTETQEWIDTAIFDLEALINYNKGNASKNFEFVVVEEFESTIYGRVDGSDYVVELADIDTLQDEIEDSVDNFLDRVDGEDTAKFVILVDLEILTSKTPLQSKDFTIAFRMVATPAGFYDTSPCSFSESWHYLAGDCNGNYTGTRASEQLEGAVNRCSDKCGASGYYYSSIVQYISEGCDGNGGDYYFGDNSSCDQHSGWTGSPTYCFNTTAMDHYYSEADYWKDTWIYNQSIGITSNHDFGAVDITNDAHNGDYTHRGQGWWGLCTSGDPTE